MISLYMLILFGYCNYGSHASSRITEILQDIRTYEDKILKALPRNMDTPMINLDSGCSNEVLDKFHEGLRKVNMTADSQGELRVVMERILSNLEREKENTLIRIDCQRPEVARVRSREFLERFTNLLQGINRNSRAEVI
ncbi:uncharacterized protein LOC144685350 [Cetorhinus maximus]